MQVCFPFTHIKRFVLLILFTVLVTLVGHHPVLAGELTVVGTGDSQSLLRDLAELFEQSNPECDVVIPESIGSSGGIRAVVAGHKVMARTARPLTPKEKALGLTSFVFGSSPVSFIANKSVGGVDSLSSTQLLDVFRGDIVNWSELGGPDQKIYLVNREAGDSSSKVLSKHIAGFAEIVAPPESIMFSTPEAFDTLTKYPYTIGYGPLAMLQPKTMRALHFNGIAPTPENVASQDYPLSTPFALVWKGQLPPLYQKFVDFFGSSQARSAMLERGVYPVTSD